VRFPFPAIAAAFRERRTVRQPIPDVSEVDVERIVHREFPGEQFDSVMAALGEYAEGRLSKECPRVHLAALKLAHGDLESLRRHIAGARQDYRDVLTAAEYPEYTRRGMFLVRQLSRKEQERIVKSDWDQYARWLGK
jgi:hypothetical protein